MIITSLRGGLGNQMFEYAIARALAVKNSTEVVMDLTRFGEDTQREYALDCFVIKGRIGSAAEIAVFNEPDNKKRTWINVKKFMQGKYLPKIREKQFTFQQDVLAKGDNVYLLGYWQTEKYFKEYEQIIREDFQVKAPLSGLNLQMADEIASSKHAVSLHIRRGDYVTDKNANKHHGLCDLDYYHRAIKILSDKFNDIHLFVFSDDLDWVRENLKVEYPMTFVGHNSTENCHEDMRLMSLCEHHIVANSSFSWWGAWLNPSPDKIVIAPKRWFQSDDLDYSDVVPDTWIKI